MARVDTLTLRLSSEERQLLVLLADRLDRSQSDTVRLLIREFARSFIRQESARGSEIVLANKAENVPTATYTEEKQ